MTLIVGNSESRLEGLNAAQFKDLKSLLSYTVGVPGSYAVKRFGPQRKYLIDRRGTFASGLLPTVSAWIHRQGLHTNLKVINSRAKPLQLHKLFDGRFEHTPYEAQTAAIDAAKLHHRGVIVAPTGSGKSLIISLLVQAFQVRTLIIVPNLELKRQLTSSLKAVFGTLKNITVQNIDNSHLFDSSDYDMLIIDEAHHAAASTYRKLNKKAWRGIYYRFCLTATPFRSKDEEQMLLQSIIGDVIYRIEYQTAVDHGFIVPLEAYYIDIPPCKAAHTQYAQAYKELIVNDPKRNEQIHRILLRLHANKISSLCLVKEIAHGDILSDNLAFPFVSGQNDERHLITKFIEGKVKTLISTTGVMGEGVDTKPCEFVIIATPVKSRNLFMQMVGRAFRRHPHKVSAKVILLRDNSHKWFKSAFREQCKILQEEYDVTPLQLELD